MKKVLFIGGDKRSVVAFSELKKAGFAVSSLALFENDNGKIEENDVLVLPVPTQKDNINIYTPLSNKIIPLKEIYEKGKNKLILCCNYKFTGLNFIDFLSLDSYAYLNAVPTAEGAIAFAIENTPFTIWNSKVLVIGNGKVGKILAGRLKALGADVTVSARKQSDFAYIKAQNESFIKTCDVQNLTKNFDLIFNTVDAQIYSNLSPLKNKVLIDVSTDGCLDFSKVKEENIKAYKLPGIPGKTAPETAGKILAETVMQLT